ncbi:hypothetical protein F3Y22_tig00112993pilonHSYRG00022 [Hibiscus syriacus]|uniref:Protein LURP-one-related 17 n=1 Tax=Hibiscus syriacus TaxID=106335 RepID=A0A6A2WQK2_HIBSY|nr:hypothetical protein F3Y22_tig00112993pilonHSYRG00022 [Hibiscus syriacus]
MFFLLKSLSRSVHDEQHQHQAELSKTQDGGGCTGTGGDICTSLTVWRKSLLEVTLMDAKGASILTIKRCKNLGLTHNWVIYRGEVGDYCTSVDKTYVYTIEGSYSNRSCKVVDERKRVVAEIKRKAAMSGGISFGLDVFMLIIKAGFDPGFAMALVLLLDQMFS